MYYAHLVSQAGCLAQLVERRPYKANVGGSTPSAPTKNPASVTIVSHLVKNE
jgi:hypothetical protein